MNNRLKILTVFVGSVFAAQYSGCSDEAEPGEGVLALELWGEEFIEERIPASELADGFEVTFDKFLINLGGFSVAQEGNSPVIEEPAMKVWDLTREGPFDIASTVAPVGEYTHTAYSIVKTISSATAGNVAQADLQLMIAEGYSIYVSGAATKGATTKAFTWGFDTETTYDPCHSEASLIDGKEATVQITIHGDHLFYDDAWSDTPKLRFNDITLADVNDDGEVTPAELLAYEINPLPNYGVGNLDIDNLWDFISHMTSTLGHIDGEGHCD